MTINDNLHKTFNIAHTEFKKNEHCYRGNSITNTKAFCSYFSGIALGLKIGKQITQEEYKSFDDMLWRMMEN